MAEQQASHEHLARRIRLGFWIHAAVYVCVNALLIYLDLSRNPDVTWFYWPLAGWGIGLAFHAYRVFLEPHGVERMIARRLKRHHHHHPA